MTGLPQRKPQAQAAADKPRNVWTALATGLLIAGVALGTMLAGRTAFFVLATAVVLVAQAELYAVLKAANHSPVVLLGLVVGGVLLIATFDQGALALALSAALPLPLLLLWGLTVPVEKVRSMIVSTYLGIVYGPFLVGFAVLLLREPNGLVLTATFIGMTAVHDSGGFLAGRKFGRHPMAPKTSPKKSWEGWLAGTLVTVGLSVIFLPLVHPFDVWLAFKLAVVMSVASPLGDLAESLVKRDLGVKDMGSLIPGHGGLFDRIDAIIFVSPIAYFVLVVLGWAG